MSTLKGKVKWFNGKKGYGFIEREDGEKDCFVHASAVREAGLRFLNENDAVEFEIQDGDKGLCLHPEFQILQRRSHSKNEVLLHELRLHERNNLFLRLLFL